MGFEFIKKLPTPAQITELYPVPEAVLKIKREQDEKIRRIFTGESDKFLVIIGPCSADHEDSVCDYVSRLAPVQEELKDKLLIIPRIYTNKPRTTGDGYKGMIHQPDPEKKPDLLAGLVAIRKLHIRAVQESGLTALAWILPGLGETALLFLLRWGLDTLRQTMALPQKENAP